MTNTHDIVRRLNETLPGMSIPLMQGDNLGTLLCSFFDAGDEETQDDTSWSEAARKGYEEVIEAIRAHYQPAAARIRELEARVAELEADVSERMLDAAIGSNADMCGSAGEEYRTLINALRRAAEARRK